MSQEILDYARTRYLNDPEFKAQAYSAAQIVAQARRVESDDEEFGWLIEAAAVGLAMQWVDLQTGRIFDE